MSGVLADRLARAFSLYEALAVSLDEGALRASLDGLPSNTLGEQLWCVIGARESYTRAIEQARWAGFTCSLSAVETAVRERVVQALRASAASATGAVARPPALSEAQEELALQLLEHEAQHHGQLIRYLYGLRLHIPDEWKTRYSLS